MNRDILHLAKDLTEPSPFDLTIEMLVRQGWTDEELLEHVTRLDEGRRWAPRRYWAARIRVIRTNARKTGTDSEPDYNGLTRSAIFAARRSHEAEGHTSEATHRRLMVSKSTLLRARHSLGLVPWPDEVE